MKNKVVKRMTAAVLTAVMASVTFTGCTFGFASDPDDPNEKEEVIPIDTSVDTFQYDSTLEGTKITLLEFQGRNSECLRRDGGGF